MKNLILIPLMFLSLTLFSQTYVTIKPSQLPAASTINMSDIFVGNQGTTTKKFSYLVLNTQLKDSFATKTALADSSANLRAAIATGGGALNSGIFKWIPDSLTFSYYANESEAPKDGFYRNTDGIATDTTLTVNSISQTAIGGVSISGVGTSGSSEENYGVYGFSTTSIGVAGFGIIGNGVYGSSVNYPAVFGVGTNNTGIEGYSISGHNNALFGSAGDSVTFPKAGGMKVYKSGELIFEITSNGTVNGYYDDAIQTSINPSSGEIYADLFNYDTTNVSLPVYKKGVRFWDTENNTTSLMVGGGVTLQDGQELHLDCQNQTGSLIAAGKAVYIIDAGGETPRIRLADNRYIPTAYKFIGVTTQSIAHGASGKVTAFGKVHDMVTNGTVEGNEIYLITDGDWSQTKPSTGHIVKLGVVTYAHASNGIILISPHYYTLPAFKVLDYDANTSISLDSTGYKQTTNGVLKLKTDTAGIIYNNQPHCAIYRNSDLTITASQNVWYKITGFTAKDADHFLVQGDSVQFKYAGSYAINFTASFSGLNNEVWELGVFKGGVLEEPSQLRYTSSSDVGNMSCPIYISVTANQWISFKIRNTTDNDDPTIKRFSAIIKTEHLTL